MSDFKCDRLLSAPVSSANRIRNFSWQNCLVVVFAFILVNALYSEVGKASDQHVLSELVGDSTIGTNVLALRQKLATRDEEERYRLLSAWVLPGASHLHFRLQGDYTPTNAAAGLTLNELQSSEHPGALSTDDRDRIQTGGNLVAPAFDLVDLAKKLGRLDELQDQLHQVDTVSIGDQHARLAMLFMVNLASGDDRSATASLTELFDMVRESDHVEVSDRWAETLAMDRGFHHGPHLKMVSELLYMNYAKFVNDLHGWRKHGDELWDSHFFSLLGRQKLREAQESSSQGKARPRSLTNWAPVRHFTARSRGQGFPQSAWSWDGERISSVSGHDQDYLMFRSPMQGDYEIECEVSSTDWHNMELFAAGTWVAPTGNRAAIEVGHFRSQQPDVPLEKPMARFGDTAQHRVVIRDSDYQVHYNGRKIHEESIPRVFDPWIAIRSEARSPGTVRNLRITGKPTVPDEVNLASQKALLGWAPYFQDSVSDAGAWHGEQTGNSSGIVGRLNPDIAGTINESLLVYHRPMLEDGTIEYEFYYEPGRSLVHPAMDRLTFLLDPAGVDIHWVTDGAYDRTELSPANRSSETDNRRGTGLLPLETQGWNNMRFTLRGDTVTLELNGEAIYERVLEATNQRTFGLFHYSDQTEARVRNIVWRGNWPKHVAPLRDQELFIPDHKCLEDLALLTEEFSHTFTDPLPDGQLEVSGTRTEEAVKPHVKGIRFTPVALPQWTGVRVNYLKPVYGDFDAVLTFENLATYEGITGACDQMLLATDESGITIRTSISQTAEDKSYATSVMTLPLPDGKKRYIKTSVPDETRNGTLRVVRRGAMVHSLIASEDSSNFRYIGSHELPSAASAITLAGMTSRNSGGVADVVVKKLTVRSNTTAFESLVDVRVTSINQFTALLPRTHRHRFAASGLDGFATIGEVQPIRTDGGLRVRAGNEKTSGGSTLSSAQTLDRNFDLSVTLNATGLLTPGPISVGGTASVSVQGENDKAILQINRTGEGTFEVSAMVQRDISESPQPETIATETVSSIDSLRLVRIQKTMIFVYSEGGLPRMLGQTDFESNPVTEGGVQLRLNARSGEVLWKSFEAKMSAPGSQDL